MIKGFNEWLVESNGDISTIFVMTDNTNIKQKVIDDIMIKGVNNYTFVRNMIKNGGKNSTPKSTEYIEVVGNNLFVSENIWDEIVKYITEFNTKQKSFCNSKQLKILDFGEGCRRLGKGRYTKKMKIVKVKSLDNGRVVWVAQAILVDKLTSGVVALGNILDGDFDLCKISSTYYR